jgi:hypothetical protein
MGPISTTLADKTWSLITYIARREADEVLAEIARTYNVSQPTISRL